MFQHKVIGNDIHVADARCVSIIGLLRDSSLLAESILKGVFSFGYDLYETL